MDAKQLKEKLNKIEMPQEMQERIIRNCYRKMEEDTMNKNTPKNIFKRPLVAVATFALCLCATGVTALAATGKLQGYFNDITDWSGAITGTSYEQATDEVELTVLDVSDHLTLKIEFVNPKIAPYGFFEQFGVESYKIVDMAGNVVAEGETTEMAEIVDGNVAVTISLDNISSGAYKLVVSELVGSSKADQPLILSGTWECEFTK